MYFYLQVREFYRCLTSCLQKNLPFTKAPKNITLDITNGKELNETTVVTMASLVPNVMPVDEVDAIKTEDQLFNLLPVEKRPNWISMEEAWQVVRGMCRPATDEQRFPLLAQLATACCTVFHGNADV